MVGLHVLCRTTGHQLTYGRIVAVELIFGMKYEKLGIVDLGIALAWLLANPQVSCPIIGANTVEQLNDSLGCLNLTLTQEEKSTLDALTSWE